MITVARGSSGSEVSPRSVSYARGPQRRRCFFFRDLFLFFYLHLIGEHPHVQRHASSCLPRRLRIYDSGPRSCSADVMQRTTRGWYIDVHVSGTLDAFDVRNERLATHAGRRHLRVRIGDLPGM